MRTLATDNRGSITIEMCFVMPVVIGVVMMLIMTILRGLNEGVALGSTQTLIYQFSDIDEGSGITDDRVKDIEKLEESMVLDKITGGFDITTDSIELKVESCLPPSNYAMSFQSCRRERNKCTQRLRRWQLYGDVLCE